MLIKIIIVMILVSISFSWGFISSRYQVFPFDYVRKSYVWVTSIYQSRLFEFSIRNESDTISAIYRDVERNYHTIRQDIKDEYILPKEMIKYNKLKISKNCCSSYGYISDKDKIKFYNIQYYGINHYGILLPGSQDRKNLLIYVQGHGGDPFNYDYFQEIYKEYSRRKYDVLVLSMTGLGFNSGAMRFPIKTGRILSQKYFNKDEAKSHYIFEEYFDPEISTTKPLSLMLSGNYYLISSILKNYENVEMIGISGGGWYTSIISSLLPDIDKSFSFSGSLPLSFRHLDENRGDWEQIYSKFWRKYDYYHLYFLSTIGKSHHSKRNTYLIFNDNDACCFKDPYATIFKTLMEKYKDERIEVIVTESNKHAIDVKTILSLHPAWKPILR